MYLARFRRSVAVVDSQSARAHRIPRPHNYPGIARGVSGVELMTLYHVQTIAAEIDSPKRLSGRFEASGSQCFLEARSVVLATGVQDVEPQIPHLAEALRDGAIRYCRYATPSKRSAKGGCSRLQRQRAGRGGLSAALYGSGHCLSDRRPHFLVGRGRARMAEPGIAVTASPLRSLNQISVAYGTAAIAAAAINVGLSS